MKQMSLSTTGLEQLTKRTRKRELLDEMNLVIPWTELLSLIAPHAPAGKVTGALKSEKISRSRSRMWIGKLP